MTEESQESHKSVDKFNYQEDSDQNQDSEFQKINYDDYNNYDQFKYSEIDENSFANHIDIAEIICWKCKQDFASKNQLHNHFRVNACWCSKTDEKQKYELQNQSIKITAVKINNDHFVLLNSCKFLKDFKIHQWSISSQIEKDTVFQRFHYVICRILLHLMHTSESVCLDSECTMIISNHDWIKKHQSDLKILQMKNSIIIKNIESIKYSTDEYVILNFYISDLINN